MERHFQKYLHRGVGEELIRKRLERACELLVATQTRVKVISEQVGFSTEKHFFKVFRTAMGTSPKQYRLTHAAKKIQENRVESRRGAVAVGSGSSC